MAARKRGDRARMPEAEAAGRDRPAGRLVDFDPWGALFGAMWGQASDEAADTSRGAGLKADEDVPARRAARPGKAARAPRRP